MLAWSTAALHAEAAGHVLRAGHVRREAHLLPKWDGGDDGTKKMKSGRVVRGCVWVHDVCE